MSLFDSVKKAVTTREAAEHYGIRVSRNGMCRCPFHSDHDPSMKVDKRFHCFGCHADGDVVDFAARLFDLSPRSAALKIASDFDIAVVDEPEKSPKPKTTITVSDAERFHHQVSYWTAASPSFVAQTFSLLAGSSETMQAHFHAISCICLIRCEGA